MTGRYLSGLRLALTTFTVLPLPAGRVDRTVAGAAMSLAPLVGALLGLVLAGLAAGLRALHAPALVLGTAVVAGGALLTRGLHLDGLADTVDGLGSYTGRERALEIMKQPAIGPFGVAALMLVVLAQAASVAALAGRATVPMLVGIVLITAVARAAVPGACLPGVPPARPSGMGALVAGTVRRPVALAGVLPLLALGLAAVPHRPWQGPLAVALALAAAWAVRRHAVARLGGVTGDVLGALVEIAATVGYLVLALG